MANHQKEQVVCIDGSYYLNAESVAQICGCAKTTLFGWRKQPNAPPYNEDLKMYPAKELGEWIRSELVYRKGRGGAYPWTPPIQDHPHYTPPINRKSSTPVTILPGMKQPDEYREDQDERVKRLRGDKLEMEIQQKAGELVNADEVLIVLSSMISRVKTRILSLPTILANTVVSMTDPVEAQLFIEERVHATLDELSSDPLKDMIDENG